MPFVKGVSGNPKGRPPMDREIKEKLSKFGPKAMRVISELLDDVDPEIRFKAAREILDRLYGKPRQQTALSVEGAEDGAPIVVIRSAKEGKEEWVAERGKKDAKS